MLPLNNKITFGEEQAMLLDIAMNFCREKMSIGEVRRQIASESGFDRELWKEIADLGWLSVAVPEQFGGSGLSLADVTAIVEPMGRHLAGLPFVSTQLFIQAVLAGGLRSQARNSAADLRRRHRHSGPVRERWRLGSRSCRERPR